MPASPEMLEDVPGDIAQADELPRYVIREIRLAHCSKGPSRCEQCRQMNVRKLCLLDLSPPRLGEVQRRVIAIQHQGGQVWREYEIVRCFESEEEASQYAREHGIQDVQLT